MDDKQQRKMYTQDELYALGQKLSERLDDLLKYFDVDLINKPKMHVGKCPLHGDSDNENSFNLYHSGYVNYCCRTHQCEKIFKPSIIGLVRGLLSHTNGWRSLKDKDKIVSFSATLEFIEKFLGNEKIEINRVDSEKRRFAQTFKGYIRNGHTGFTRDYIRSKLIIPPKYYIDRGYLPETLDQYDIGLCNDSTKPFYNRIVVPIYDDDYTQIVGYTARSIFNRCNNCKFYHDNSVSCPSQEDAWRHAKWINNKDFQRDSYLYNYWFAREHIKQSGIIVLVEGVGDVLRLVESGIKNAVGIFGTTLTDCQKFIIDCSGAYTILTMLDNDEAGQKAANDIKEKCKKLYEIKNYIPNKRDVGEMNSQDIKNILKF